MCAGETRAIVRVEEDSEYERNRKLEQVNVGDFVSEQKKAGVFTPAFSNIRTNAEPNYLPHLPGPREQYYCAPHKAQDR
jgi:hypothetical protein